MKWFKHETNCLLSEGLNILIEKEGFAGYGRWWRLLEIIAAKMDSTDKCCSEYSRQKWRKLLEINEVKFSSFLKIIEENLNCKIFLIKNEIEFIKIEIPNLLKIRDEYSRKSGHCQDNVAQDKDKDKEKDTDKEIKTDLCFKDFWFSYPKKIAKARAIKAWSKIKEPVKTLELIKNALSWQVQTDQWVKNHGQFIPLPATYLNDNRWIDEPPSGFKSINHPSHDDIQAALQREREAL